jgi:hypothetical protein
VARSDSDRLHQWLRPAYTPVVPFISLSVTEIDAFEVSVRYKTRNVSAVSVSLGHLKWVLKHSVMCDWTQDKLLSDIAFLGLNDCFAY